MDSVGAVMRQKMDKTLAGLNDKLEALERRVSGTVRTVTDSVSTVKDSFDVKLQVRRRPWTLLAGATALGFLGGLRLRSHGAGHPAQNGKNDGAPPARVVAAAPPCSDANDGTNGANAARHSHPAATGWGAGWGGRFQPEISALRGVAMGALLELAREMITRPAARPPRQPAAEVNRVSNGNPETRAVPGRVSAKRRAASSALHPLEDLSDGKTVRRPR